MIMIVPVGGYSALQDWTVFIIHTSFS